MLEVEVIHPETDELGPAGSRVEQHHDHGGVPADLEVLAGAGREQPSQRLIGKDGDGLCSGMAGGFMLAIGSAVISPSSTSQA